MPLEALIDAAETSSIEKNWNRAVDHWTACFSHPDAQPAPRWYAALGNALMALNKPHRAIEILEPARKRHPRAPECALGLARAYTRAERWSDGADAWATAIADFPGRARTEWRVQYAECLGQQARWDEAEEQAAQILAEDGERVAILALHARCAQEQGKWKQAVERWERCFAVADSPRPLWLMDRAVALQVIGRNAEATSAFAQVQTLGKTASRDGRRAFVQAMSRARRGEELAQTFQHGFLKDAPTDISDLTAARCLITCNRVDDARQIFDRILPELPNGPAMVRALSIVALAYDDDERPARYRQIADLAKRQLALGDEDPAPLHRARIGAAFGTRDIDLMREVISFAMVADPITTAPARKILRRLETLDDPAHRRGKVFCIGLSKTGTTSLTSALSMLGYSAAHWSNPYTSELLDDRDLLLFDALSDTPITWQFRRLEEEFPDARFIFTSRPLDDWRRSWQKHMIRDLGVADFDGFMQMIESPDRIRYGARYRQIHRDLYGRHGDADTAFLKLGEEVRDHFSGARAHKLLEFDVFAGDGFEKLCRFLDRPIPQEPFPWTNAAHQKPQAIYAAAS